ncbi:MAG: hypothetical protein L0332_25455 [Chloroflexi bacterium]|nr:hypothetical protein [Chloroflexota bacterium]MCI0730045.1 hypothetical protein [Chloroflexota bacterium]
MSKIDDNLLARIKAAVAAWAKDTFDTDEIIVGMAAEDAEEEEEGRSYLVDVAVRTLGYRLVAGVWVEDGEILSVYDLGEGLPLDEAAWPWAEDERRP